MNDKVTKVRNPHLVVEKQASFTGKRRARAKSVYWKHSVEHVFGAARPVETRKTTKRLGAKKPPSIGKRSTRRTARRSKAKKHKKKHPKLEKCQIDASKGEKAEKGPSEAPRSQRVSPHTGALGMCICLHTKIPRCGQHALAIVLPAGWTPGECIPGP